MATTQVEYSNVVFTIDTMDWSDEDRRQIAEDELICGIHQLSTTDAHFIGNSWPNSDAEFQSRSVNDDVAQIVERIEGAARAKAMADWKKRPNTGHNCYISTAQGK